MNIIPFIKAFNDWHESFKFVKKYACVVLI